MDNYKFYKETPTYLVYKKRHSCCGYTSYKTINKRLGNVQEGSHIPNEVLMEVSDPKTGGKS